MKETIEAAAERLYPAEWDWKEKESFIEGAQWQQQTMYSEEEVEGLLKGFRLYSYNHGCGSAKFEEWFEQFKKK